MQCEFCGQVFKNDRKTAKFCTNKCRVYYNRNIKVNKKDLDNIISVTKNKVSVTDSVTKAIISVIKKDSATIPVPLSKIPVINKKVKKYYGAFGICPKHKGSSYFTCGCAPKEVVDN